MIYAYTWIQMNSEQFTTNYHTFLKLHATIYFAIMMMRQISEEDRSEDISH